MEDNGLQKITVKMHLLSRFSGRFLLTEQMRYLTPESCRGTGENTIEWNFIGKGMGRKGMA